MNMYAYVGNDPVNATDPEGEEEFKAIGKFVFGKKGRGVKIRASIAFDTKTSQLTVSLETGPGVVVGGFKGGNFKMSDSAESPAVNSASAKLNVVAEANAAVPVTPGGFGPGISISQELVSIGTEGAAGLQEPKLERIVGKGASLSATVNAVIEAKIDLASLAETLGIGEDRERDK